MAAVGENKQHMPKAVDQGPFKKNANTKDVAMAGLNGGPNPAGNKTAPVAVYEKPPVGKVDPKRSETVKKLSEFQANQTP